MSIRSLTPDEISARMQDLFARASALKAHADRAGIDASSAIRAGGLGTSSKSDDNNGISFSDVLRDAVRGVSDAQMTAQAKAQAYQLGDDKVSLEEVMISIQKAGLAMQGMVQVRNRLMEAYREMTNMQV
jgi:flagellar hook-basal body complex protein FliE